MMETRRMITALVASIAIFYLWMVISTRIWPPEPPTTQPVAATQPAGATQPGTATRPSGAFTKGGAATATTPARGGQGAPAWVDEGAATQGTAAQRAAAEWVEGGADESPIELGSAADDSPFPMQLTIRPRGATVARAAIRDYYETIEKESPYPVLSPMVLPDAQMRDATFYSFATRKLTVKNLDLEVWLDDVVWRVDRVTGTEAALSVVIKSPQGDPLLRVVKTYTLAQQSREEDTYDVTLMLRVENLSDMVLEPILVQRGPVGFRSEEPRREDRRVLGAIWRDGNFKVKGFYRSDIVKKGVLPLAGDDDRENERIAWAAETNKFFTCIMAPAQRVSPDVPVEFARLEAIPLMETAADHAEDLSFQFISAPVSVKPGQGHEVGFDCYIGPKSKSAFQNVPTYVKRDYYQVIREGFYFCAIPALVSLMMSMLSFFHMIPPHNYGLAIIVLVLVVKGVMHPITKKGQINMLKMQKQQQGLQPKLQALKEKYANDRAKQNQAMMDLYREEGINPASNLLGCLPMMLQLPIWAALWTALASTIEMRHAPLDGWWIRDLAGPDALYTFSEPVNIPFIGFLMGGPVDSLNLLPILLGVSQLLQARYMPHSRKPQAATTEANDQMEQQRKMMMFMSVFFVFILYNAPSGLNLYIMSSNLFSIFEQLHIKKHLADYEAREESRKHEPKEPREKGWLAKKWENLQKEAEAARQFQREQNQKKKTPKRRR